MLISMKLRDSYNRTLIVHNQIMRLITFRHRIQVNSYFMTCCYRIITVVSGIPVNQKKKIIIITKSYPAVRVDAAAVDGRFVGFF